MRQLVMVVGLLAACDGEPAPAELVPEVPASVEPTPPPKLEADARALAMSGRHADAAAHASADAVLAAREGARASGPSAWSRAMAALRVGDGAAASAAAASAAAGERDAVYALAVLAGGSAPGDVGPLAALAGSPRQDSAAASAVTGWQAAAVRGEVLLRRGDVVGALVEADAAATAAPVEGNLWRASAVERGLADSDRAIEWSKAAAAAAIESADGEALLEACGILTATHGQLLQVDQGLADVRALYDAVVEEHGELGTGTVGVALSQAAMIAGRPLQAQEAAAAARAALADPGDTSRAAWMEGWAAYQLGEVEAIEAARDAASGAHRQALAALAALAQGLPPSETTALPVSGLTDRELATLNVEAALLAPESSSERLSAAIAAADRTGDIALRVYTRLAAEAAARANSDARAAAIRAELRTLFRGKPPQSLAVELAVRGLIDGAGPGPLAGDAAVLQAWGALAAGTATEAVAGAWFDGLTAWSRGRAKLSDSPGEAAVAFNEALGSLPVHRQGLLSLGTALDGSQGVDIGRDLDVLAGASSDDELSAALSVHELSHRLNEVRADAALGRDMTAGMPDERRRELRAAAARARVEMLQFHLGGPFPDDMLSAIVEAERDAASEEPFQRTVSTPGTPLDKLRESMSGACIISYAEVDNRVSGLVISPAAGLLADVGDIRQITDLTAAYRDQLEAETADNALSSNELGDRIRQLLIEPFSPVLTGFGRYLVVGPSDLLSFSLATLPEEASGLRYLADIRTITQGSSLRLLQLPDREVISYKPEFLGIGERVEPEVIVIERDEEEEEEEEEEEADPLTAALAAEPAAEPAPEPAEVRIVQGSDTPGDLRSASRHFGPGFRTMVIGDEATESVYQEGASEARHVYIAGLPATSDGGFVMAGGELTLSEVRAQPIVAQVVFISAPAPQELQAHRARAFLEAGARAVVVTNWEMPEQRLNKMVDSFYESLNRDRSPVLALSDARQAMLREARNDQPEFIDNPALWGAIMLYGAL